MRIISPTIGHYVNVAAFARVYPSHPASIKAARRDLAAFLKRCGCPGDDLFDICLSVAEAVANAVEHGHVPGSDVTVDCRCDEDVTIAVRDEGGGMRAKTWQGVLVKAAIGGYGMMLMRALMDDVKLEIDEDFGATVIMHKRCAWKQAHAQRPTVTNGKRMTFASTT